jgi:hypothetical protein
MTDDEAIVPVRPRLDREFDTGSAEFTSGSGNVD